MCLFLVVNKKMIYIEPIFVFVGSILHSMVFGVALQESFFAEVSPRQYTSLFYNITHFIIYTARVVEERLLTWYLTYLSMEDLTTSL